MSAPATVGESFGKRLRLDEPGIVAFATSVDDWNPLHHDREAAQAAGYPGLIASGTQIGSLMMALTATHFSKPDAQGRRRSGLGVGFALRFRAVVLADEDIEIEWRVTAVDRKDRLDGWITQVEGAARSPRGPLLEGTGTLLLRFGEPR